MAIDDVMSKPITDLNWDLITTDLGGLLTVYRAIESLNYLMRTETREPTLGDGWTYFDSKAKDGRAIGIPGCGLNTYEAIKIVYGYEGVDLPVPIQRSGGRVFLSWQSTKD